MDWTTWGPVVAAIPILGGLLYWLGPRLYRWWQFRRWMGLPILRPGGGGGQPLPVRFGTTTMATVPESLSRPPPVELLSLTPAVGSFIGHSVPYPTPTNTLRRVSAVAQ